MRYRCLVPYTATPETVRPILERDAGTSVRQKLDELRAPDDARASDEVVFVQLPLLEARRAHVDRAATLREVVHQLAQRREALLLDRFGEASGREANAFDAQEHERLLARAERGVREHEADGGAVGVVLAVREIDAETCSHVSAPFDESCTRAARPTPAYGRSAGTRPAGPPTRRYPAQ